LIAEVEKCPEDKWGTARSKPEDWPACVVAHHIASSHGAVSGIAMMIANGQPMPPVTVEMIHEGNARHAREFANVGKAETLKMLREEGAKAAQLVRGLSDEQLDRTADLIGRPMSAAAVIEHILIDHARQHTESFKGALA
jgi:hypothetical protein